MEELGLLPKLILGIIIGIILGKMKVLVIVQLLATFNGLFGNFLGFVIPLIIIAIRWLPAYRRSWWKCW